MNDEVKKEGAEIPEEKFSRLNEKLDKIALMLERTNIGEYVQLAKAPWKIVLFNLLGGIARGFGVAIGMTVIVAITVIIVTRILAQLITLPFVGQQIANLVELVNQYMQEGAKLQVK